MEDLLIRAALLLVEMIENSSVLPCPYPMLNLGDPDQCADRSDTLSEYMYHILYTQVL